MVKTCSTSTGYSSTLLRGQIKLITTEQIQMLVFGKRGKIGEPGGKNFRNRVENQKTQSTYDSRSRNRTRDTLVEDECSHHHANPAPCFPGWWEGRYTSVRFKFFMELLIFATYLQSSSQRLQLGLPALKQTAHTQSTESNISRRSDWWPQPPLYFKDNFKTVPLRRKKKSSHNVNNVTFDILAQFEKRAVKIRISLRVT